MEATGSGAGFVQIIADPDPLGKKTYGSHPEHYPAQSASLYVQYRYILYSFVQIILHLAGGGERRLQRGAGCHGGVQARQEETKEDQERGERKDQRFVSHSAFFFSSFFWIRIRIDLALLNPDPHQSSQYGSGSRFRRHKFYKRFTLVLILNFSKIFLYTVSSEKICSRTLE
jgi:hypothetical protein